MISPSISRTDTSTRQDDDLVSIMLLAEALGVPNPAGFYSAELLPVVYDQVHDWHAHRGLDHSPLEYISCC